tara:strand:- start:19047 stop:20336 length:1290 start_codon:yes stop_codon:yes gene_type:complete
MEKTKPEWLQALEAQSWQAELIASGLAIYGSLSMGVYIDSLTEWAVLRFDDRILNILYFLFIYVYAAHAVLVISFISHLALRILWAGILGLSSVYPGGINLDTKAYAPHFKEKLKREFPDLSAYSLELDKQCSMIFSVLCAMIIVLACTSLWILAYLILSGLLLLVLPVAIVNYIGFGFIAVILVSAIFAGLFVQGKYKESAFAKKYAYKMNQKWSRIMYFFGYRAFSYISQTIRTNVTSKLFFVGMMVILILSMLLSMPRFEKIIPYYKASSFVQMNGHESYVVSRNYLDKLENKRILDPVIQSEIIRDHFIKLYIPIYKREELTMTTNCGTFDWNNDLSTAENRRLRDQFKVACASQYYQLALDGKEPYDVNYQYRRKLYNNKEGFEIFIAIDSLQTGMHTLQIKSNYTSKDSIHFQRNIPFYKTVN